MAQNCVLLRLGIMANKSPLSRQTATSLVIRFGLIYDMLRDSTWRRNDGGMDANVRPYGGGMIGGMTRNMRPNGLAK